MVREANERQTAAERSLQESTMQVEVLSAEVSALKTLVLTSTPSRPNAHLHPQIDQPSGAYSCSGMRSETLPEGYSVFLSYESSICKIKHPRVPFSSASRIGWEERGGEIVTDAFNILFFCFFYRLVIILGGLLIVGGEQCKKCSKIALFFEKITLILKNST